MTISRVISKFSFAFNSYIRFINMKYTEIHTRLPTCLTKPAPTPLAGHTRRKGIQNNKSEQQLWPKI